MSASPVAESGPWSLGTLVGFPIATVCAVALIVAGVWCWRRSSRFDRGTVDRDSLRWFLGLPGTVCGALLAIAIASPIGMYPYDSEFHQWREVTGEVDRIDSRLVADGEGMSERYIFVIDGHKFGVDDTRAAAASKGDTVTLRCKREWQYAANSGWGCRWAGVDES